MHMVLKIIIKLVKAHINFLGDKLAMPFALGLFIGIGLFILYATGSYYLK